MIEYFLNKSIIIVMKTEVLVMKAFKRICLAVVACLTFVLASCGISQGYADKVNDAAADKNYIQYVDAKKALGGDCVDLTATVLGSTNGVLIAVKGCKTKEDLEKKLEDGKTIEGIIITVLNNNCMSAAYRKITAEDLGIK